MIDFAARLDDLVQFLESKFGVTDRMAIEILLSTLAPCPATPAVWLVLETNWFARECWSAWFSLGGRARPVSLAKIRSRRPYREAARALNQWLETPERTRLLIEPDPDQMAIYRNMPEVFFVLAKALRLRTLQARSPITLGHTLNDDQQRRRLDELAALTSSVLDDPTGARGHVAPSFQVPPDMVYHTELVERLSPWHRDFNQILTGLGALAVRHAWLYGRSATNAEDQQVMARAAADMVPPWIRRALESLLAEEPRASRAPTLVRNMQMPRAAYRTQSPTSELRRLRKRGILRLETKPPVYRLVAEHVPALARILAGRAFEGQAVAAMSR